jgi:hypothetical protein
MRKLTLFILVIFATNLSFAQKGIELGIEFTPAITFIINNEDFDRDFYGPFTRMTFGYNTGLSFAYNFNDNLGISSGIMFSRQGQKYLITKAIYALPDKPNKDFFERELSYIRVPLLFKLNSGISYFRIGPHFDFLQDASYEYIDNGAREAYYSNWYEQDKVSLLRDPEFRDLAIYKKFVLGLTIEFGGNLNINEYLKLTFMLHMSGNLNSEDVGAAEAAGPPFLFSPPTRTPLMYPTDPGGGRGAAYNVMCGINVGFRYTIMMD